MVGVVGLELDGALEVLHRLVVIADAEIGPAERVDDVAVVRPLLDGAADHVHAFVEIDALVDPGIAEVIEHQRLVRKQLERLLQIGFGLRPLLRALVADAAEIEHHPVRLLRHRQVGDGLAVDVGAFGELLAAAQDVAERHDRFGVLRMFGDQMLRAASWPRRCDRANRDRRRPGFRRCAAAATTAGSGRRS